MIDEGLDDVAITVKPDGTVVFEYEEMAIPLLRLLMEMGHAEGLPEMRPCIRFGLGGEE